MSLPREFAQKPEYGIKKVGDLGKNANMATWFLRRLEVFFEDVNHGNAFSHSNVTGRDIQGHMAISVTSENSA